ASLTRWRRRRASRCSSRATILPRPTSSPPSAPRDSAVRITVTLCAAEILGMFGFSAVPALLPELQAAWRLSATEAGTLTGAFFAGYMVSVPLLTALTDRVDARKIYLAATLIAALANLGLALAARSFASGLALQV